MHLDLAAGPPEASRDRYARAGELLGEWKRDGAIVRRDEETYFAYEMRFHLDGRPGRIRGLCCAMELEDWGGDILPHERTMPKPRSDRLELLREGLDLPCTVGRHARQRRLEFVQLVRSTVTAEPLPDRL